MLSAASVPFSSLKREFMQKVVVVIFSLLFCCVLCVPHIPAQSGRARRPAERRTTAAPTPAVTPTTPANNVETNDAPPTAVVGADDDEVVRVETNLITVPVSVLDRDGKYIPDLRKEDFRLFENDAEQEVAFFAPVDQPFTVALVLDMSGSTGPFRREIQRAANAFAGQLRAGDRAMVVSFASEIKVMCEPTDDRRELYNAISLSAQPEGSTTLYDAVDFVLNRKLKNIKGRKAIILFTDGMDTASRQATFESTLRDAEEADALIYPVQYDTRTLSNPNNTQPTPTITVPGIPFPIPNRVPQMPQPRGGGQTPRNRRPASLPDAHLLPSRYLEALARKTGARHYRAEKLADIGQSFALIAEELRHQYSLGYYPKTIAKAGEQRRIKVKVNRTKVAVRARETYVVPSATDAAQQQTGTRRFTAHPKSVSQNH